jgi:DUF3048 family protein
MRLKLLLLALLLAACASPTPTNVVVVTNPPPTEPGLAATDFAPEPTSTPAPTLPAPTAVIVTPQTVQQYGPDNFPPDVNPLTGLQVADASVLERRPIAVKVSEFPRRVRPQYGLSLADLVWEHFAEAGVTRMTAIFLGNESPKVGSIRSARLIDIPLAQSYKAVLVTSGSSQGTLDRLAKTDFYDRVIAEATGYTECPPLCREQDASQTTDKLFASTKDLWDTTTSLGLNTRQDLHGMAFFPDPPAGGTPATTIHINFHLDDNVTEWRYDATTGRYARWVDTATVGELAPHTDAVNAEQLTAANVVVLYVNHVPTDIVEDFADGGHCGYEIQLWGNGPAKLFRDGFAYDVTWVRFNITDVIGFVGPDNKVIPFKPGNTWFEILNLSSPTDFADGVFTARFKGPSQSAGCPTGQ